MGNSSAAAVTAATAATAAAAAPVAAQQLWEQLRLQRFWLGGGGEGKNICAETAMLLPAAHAQEDLPVAPLRPALPGRQACNACGARVGIRPHL